jgi:hypothetical protein
MNNLENLMYIAIGFAPRLAALEISWRMAIKMVDKHAVMSHKLPGA